MRDTLSRDTQYFVANINLGSIYRRMIITNFFLYFLPFIVVHSILSSLCSNYNVRCVVQWNYEG